MTSAGMGLMSIFMLFQCGCPPTPPPSNNFDVTVTVVGQGTVTKSGTSPMITLTAVASNGWRFDGWSRNDVPNEPQITVDARNVTSITATFVFDPLALDSDGDGVPDTADQCPATPAGAAVDDRGCAAGSEPDSDGDGVPDDVDDCPNTPSTVQVNAQGCPIGDPNAEDTDGDGVGDDIDQCPNTPPGASVDANGCAANERDTDGDGVVDSIDQCPNTSPRVEVDAVGCPLDPTGNGGGAVCGNGVREGNEECDDGNTVGGDGCSPTCKIEIPTGLTNNSCASPIAVTDGETETSNVGATTDGPNEPLLCDFFGRTQVESDVWYCYTATCTGQAIMTMCGSSYDTKMAVYSGCGCPSGMNSAIACSDDDCGSGVENVQSRVTVNVVSGQQYMIRVGGFIGEQGEGRLNIQCGQGDVCATASGDCLVASLTGSPGCGDEACCNAVCVVDQFCCDVEWDGFCASEAEGFCDGSFSSCSATAGSCSTGKTTPGCSNVDCCNTVCQRDPFCCIDRWDDNCVSEANAFCALTCDSRAGSCFTVHGTPGCNSVLCCQQICPDDPFCCDTEWDTECVQSALQLCQ